MAVRDSARHFCTEAVSPVARSCNLLCQNHCETLSGSERVSHCSSCFELSLIDIQMGMTSGRFAVTLHTANTAKWSARISVNRYISYVVWGLLTGWRCWSVCGQCCCCCCGWDRLCAESVHANHEGVSINHSDCAVLPFWWMGFSTVITTSVKIVYTGIDKWVTMNSDGV